MPEQALRFEERSARLHDPARRGVADRVDRDLVPDPRDLLRPVEETLEVPRVPRSATRAGEDERAPDPAGLGLEEGPHLRDEVLVLERVLHPTPELRLLDPDLPGLQVDLLPAEGEDLAATRAGEEERLEDGQDAGRRGLDREVVLRARDPWPAVAARRAGLRRRELPDSVAPSRPGLRRGQDVDQPVPLLRRHPDRALLLGLEMDGVEREREALHGAPLLALSQDRLQDPELAVAGRRPGPVALPARAVALDLEEREARPSPNPALIVQDEVPKLRDEPALEEALDPGAPRRGVGVEPERLPPLDELGERRGLDEAAPAAGRLAPEDLVPALRLGRGHLRPAEAPARAGPGLRPVGVEAAPPDACAGVLPVAHGLPPFPGLALPRAGGSYAGGAATV